MEIKELKELWNANADEYNSWDDLGLDEIVAFAQKVEREKWKCHAYAKLGAERDHMAPADVDAVQRFLGTLLA